MKFLRNDSLLGRIFATAGEIIVLNLIFLVCCLPVFTIGAACTGLCYAFLGKRRGISDSVVRAFFHAFKVNFRQATPAWLALLGLGVILYVDVAAFCPGGLMPNTPMFVFSLALGMVALLCAVYLFAVIAAFSNTLKNLVVQSFFLAAKNLPWSLLMAALLVVPLYLTFLVNLQWMLVGISCWVFFGFGLLGYVDSAIYLRIFKPYLSAVSSEGVPRG
jgi:uncharacterized membrane protein YesL